MPIKIALAGNPNSGKTTMFNELTGSNQYVGNWPGVTVEKKEGNLKGRKDVIITDLPGIYSLSPYTLEEVVARNYLLDETPDVIINIVDATNIERNLYLTTQLAEMGVPMVIALNMMDIIQKTGDRIDVAKLSKHLGCPVLETSALKGAGAREVVEKAIELAQSNAQNGAPHRFSPSIETALAEIQGAIGETVKNRTYLRFYAIKLFGRDEKMIEDLAIDPSILEQIEQVIARCEDEQDDDAESIITSERYLAIEQVVAACVVKKNKSRVTTSDKIDKIVTNRFLALPIFAFVMWFVYFVSVTTVGTLVTDWTNDGLFGQGWFMFGKGAAQFEQASEEYKLEQAKVDAFLQQAAQQGLDVEAAQQAQEQGEFSEQHAASFAEEAARQGIVATLKTEEGVVFVDAAGFLQALTVEEPKPSDFGPWVNGVPVYTEALLEAANAPAWLMGLVLDGIVGGVGSVLGFVPQMLILFLLLSFLEDCGYMARVAFIMDRVFRKFGLSGKSFIPMLISSGCGVPGIMATRTIENEKDRRITIMLTTFVPCGAKLPIIALVAGALFSGAAWVAPFAYFLGVLMIILSGIILKKTRLFAGDPAPFVMELPQYHMPGLKGLLNHTWERSSAFVVKAGTVIFVACGAIWFLSSFGFADGGFGMVAAEESLLAAVGNSIAWLFIPLGFGNWQSVVATITGLAAKENVVGTLGVLYGITEATEATPSLLHNLTQSFTTVSALSFMIFNLLCAPCFAAISAARRELGSWKWTAIALSYQTLLAYVVAFIVYQLGSVFVLGTNFSIGTTISIALIGMVIWLLVRSKERANNKQVKRASATA